MKYFPREAPACIKPPRYQSPEEENVNGSVNRLQLAAGCFTLGESH